MRIPSTLVRVIADRVAAVGRANAESTQAQVVIGQQDGGGTAVDALLGLVLGGRHAKLLTA